MSERTSVVSYPTLFDSIRYYQPRWSDAEVAAYTRHWMDVQSCCRQEEQNARRRFFRRILLVADVEQAMAQAAMGRSNKRRAQCAREGVSPPAD